MVWWPVDFKAEAKEFTLEHYFSPSNPDVLQQADRPQTCGHGTGTEADKRQGDARDRHYTQIHAYILEDVEEKHRQHTRGDQGALFVFGLVGNAETAPDQGKEERQQEETADKPQLFTHYGEDKVRFVFRDIAESSLRPLEEALAGKTSGSHGDHGLD